MVEEKWPGIYIVRGDILPIQIIDNRKLSGDENIWLKDLDNKLDAPELRRITTKIKRQGKDKAARIKAYLDVIARANIESLREVGRMSDSVLTLDEVLEEIGLTAKWEARGMEKGMEKGRAENALEIARNALAQGASIDFVNKITGLDIETIKQLANKP